MPEQQQTLTVEQALDLAVRHHNEGRLSQAENIYQQILKGNPNQPVALHLLGVLAHQTGKNGVAVDLITKALAIKPDYAEAHSNLGITLHEVGKLDEAVARLGAALAIKPDFAEAHNNLGMALMDLGKPEDALVSYSKALNFKPDLAEAHNNLGTALRDLGKPEDAAVRYRKALDLKPDYAQAYNNLGTVLRDLGKPEDAVISYRKALDLKPEFAEVHSNLGITLQELNKPDEALARHRSAISLNPRNDLFYTNFAKFLMNVSFTSVDNSFYQDLLHLLERPVCNVPQISRPVIRALRHHPDFSPIAEILGSTRQDGKIPYRDIAEQLSRIPLFLKLLELSPVYDVEIEQALTLLRRAMIQEVIGGKGEEKVFPFSTALAHNCFANEYVFIETEEEKEAAQKLALQIAILMEAGRSVPPSFVVALGAYQPLFQFSWAKALSEQEWGHNIKSLIKRQITEPLEERSLHDQIGQITPVQNSISQAVRDQYEENPYPRWVKTDLAYNSGNIGTILRASPHFFDLGDYTFSETPEILIAGCGTGLHALTTASRFSNAHVLAVDLSSHSLAYAERKTRELGFSNIEYVQGDILELGKLERQFDLIECVGVLHHLEDPLAGWRVLVDLLHPRGLMKIGLYSEVGRRDIVVGRSLVAKKGYSTSPEDIRRCRQDIIAEAGNGNKEMLDISRRNDFFSLSNCRDLLFHVQEHRFTLPQIDQALTSLHLKFLGFEMPTQKQLQKFRKTYTNSEAMTSLSLWQNFELENPRAFHGMYQFWCNRVQKL